MKKTSSKFHQRIGRDKTKTIIQLKSLVICSAVFYYIHSAINLLSVAVLTRTSWASKYHNNYFYKFSAGHGVLYKM